MVVDTTERRARAMPVGVMVLVGLASIAFVLSVVHLLQALGIVPYVIGSIGIRDFNIWYALLWGLMIWVWAWVIRGLVNLDPSAWLFVLVVSGFNLLFDFITMLTAPAATTDLSVSFVLNLVIFGYTLLPGTKRAFAVA